MAMRDRVGVVLAAMLAVIAGGSALAQSRAEVLAPRGTLRVGVYQGSPTSLVPGPSGERHGLAVEIGQALGRRLGVPVTLIEYPRIAKVLDGLREGEADVTVTNATPARAETLAFSETLLTLELGYLVPAGSSVGESQDLDRTGRRIGVTQGGTSETVLARELPKATLVSVASVSRAVEMLRAGELDAFATNKAILFGMSDELPGSRVLAGRWGRERLAIAVPKGREAALADLRLFIEESRANGLLAGATARAGLRGAAIDP